MCILLIFGVANTCDRELRALNISKNTKQVNVMVVSRGVISLSRSWKKNIY